MSAPNSAATGVAANWLVVGVDGSKFGLGAVRWAMAEAARRHWTVRLVHVQRDRSPWARAEETDAQDAQRAKERLRAAERIAAKLSADVAVESLIAREP